MNVPTQKRAEGGRTQSQKVYYCTECGSISGGNRFVSEHLAKPCKGQTAKTAFATKRNEHRLEEAIANTREWKANRLIDETNALFKEFKQDALRDLENIKEINREVMEDMLRSYYTKLF